MNECWIILLMLEEQDLGEEVRISFIEDIAACDDEGSLLVFDSVDAAHYYQEENAIDGKCVELPIY